MAYLALDLGAGSGRAIVGVIENGKVKIDEVHRFDNKPVQLGNTLYWNFLALFAEIKEGIRLAVQKGYDLKGIGVDTWGVDFGLIDQSGKILSNPVCYRDTRTEGLSESSENLISKSELYAYTGIQQMDINTIFQLLSLKQNEDPTLTVADKLLFTPDLINYYLTGKAVNEYTIASTSQLLNAKDRTWEQAIFDKLSIPSQLMQEIVYPGEVIGKLDADIADEVGVKDVNIFAVGSHDTASAIGSIPLDGNDWAFLSSGTWSLLGLLTEKPVLTDEAMLNNFTNEGGVDGKILFMRNITGLWLLQQLIAEWKKEDNDPNTYSYPYLLSECEKSEPFRSVVNSDDPAFTHPASMKAAIQEYCKNSNQAIPETKGQFVRCVLESLALKNYFVMEKLKANTQRDIKRLYIVGGGSQNEILNQYIADALNMEVLIGLTEGTAIGNIMQQAIANGEVENWTEAHQMIKATFPSKSYYPRNNKDWMSYAKQVSVLFPD